jgi:hypothetical protein
MQNRMAIVLIVAVIAAMYDPRRSGTNRSAS